jgi:nitroreductase
MASRRSVRRFRPEAPPRELIERILESAVTAPSASNKQPWRFLVVRNLRTIEAMAVAVRAAVDWIAQAIDPDFETSFRAYGDYFTRFENAPVVIVPFFRSLLAIQNLLLSAHASGLGASGMTGPLVVADRIRELLSVAPSWEIAALIPIGYPDESPEPTHRRPVTQGLD